MNLLLFIFCFAVCWAALHYLIKDQIVRQTEEEVTRQFNERENYARRQYEAVHEIRDQLRSTSHDMIATALEAGVRQQGQVDQRDADRRVGRDRAQ